MRNGEITNYEFESDVEWQGWGGGGEGTKGSDEKKLRCGLRAKIQIRDFLNTKQDNVQTATS